MIQVQQHGSVTAIQMTRTFLGRPLYWTTAYWLDGLLIDSGPPSLAHELVRVVRDLAVEQIAVTHAHEDQIGGLHRLRQQFPQARIYASPRAMDRIQHFGRRDQRLYRRLLWGVPKPVRDLRPLPMQIQTDHFTLRVVETPGHSQGHVSFFEPKHRWLFSGDAFIGGQDRAASAESELFGMISSLRTLAALRPERLFPASGKVRRTPEPEIHGKIAQLLGLCQQVARLDRTGLSTPEIVERLLGGETRMKFWTQGEISAVNLIQACRRYNEIFTPMEQGPFLQPPSRRSAHGSASGSSASQSADPDDLRSAK